MLESLRCGVIGVGHLGKFHAQKYFNLPACKLVCLVDSDVSKIKKLALDYNCLAISDYKEIVDKVDAVSIAVPTQAHFEVAQYFLERGKHVLLEKPITDNLKHAVELKKLAQKKNLILQIGHIERFNPVTKALVDILVGKGISENMSRPLYMESNRQGSFTSRASKNSIVIDLMIHDIDLIYFFSGFTEVLSLEAIGKKILTENVDIANARLNLGGCFISNINASRVSTNVSRKMRIFYEDLYCSLDFHKKKLTVIEKKYNKLQPDRVSLVETPVCIKEADALELQIQAFLHCIDANLPPQVDADAGIIALKTAEMIEEVINSPRTQEPI